MHALNFTIATDLICPIIFWIKGKSRSVSIDCIFSIAQWRKHGNHFTKIHSNAAYDDSSKSHRQLTLCSNTYNHAHVFTCQKLPAMWKSDNKKNRTTPSTAAVAVAATLALRELLLLSCFNENALHFLYVHCIAGALFFSVHCRYITSNLCWLLIQCLWLIHKVMGGRVQRKIDLNAWNVDVCECISVCGFTAINIKIGQYQFNCKSKKKVKPKKGTREWNIWKLYLYSRSSIWTPNGEICSI